MKSAFLLNILELNLLPRKYLVKEFQWLILLLENK